MYRRTIAAVLAVLVILVGGMSQPLAKTLDIPPLTGRVVDQAAILSKSQEADLAGKLQSLENKTTIQLVVVTLKSLQGRPIEEWGIALGRGWGIGQAGKDNGVLLIVAPTERDLRIEVGYGLEGTLPDATADAIIRHVIVPRFKAGNMASGISDGVDAIGRALTGERLAYSEARTAFSWKGFLALTPLWFFFIFAVVAFSIQSLRRMGDDDNLTGSGDSDSDSSWGSSTGSSWSSGSSGGGFSGGGGSFGGGGASGKW